MEIEITKICSDNIINPDNEINSNNVLQVRELKPDEAPPDDSLNANIPSNGENEEEEKAAQIEKT